MDCGDLFQTDTGQHVVVRQSPLAAVWRDALVAVIFLSPERANKKANSFYEV